MATVRSTDWPRATRRSSSARSVAETFATRFPWKILVFEPHNAPPSRRKLRTEHDVKSTGLRIVPGQFTEPDKGDTLLSTRDCLCALHRAPDSARIVARHVQGS